MDSKNKLIISNLLNFWPENPAECAFLGPWCFADNKNCEFHESTNFTLIPPPWTTSELKSHYTVQRSLLQEIVENLVNVFEDESERIYWKTLFTPWLIHWIGVLYDRYHRLKKADKFVEKNTLVECGHFETWFSDADEFWTDIFSHEFNFKLLSDILLVGEWENLKIKTQKFSFSYRPKKSKMKHYFQKYVKRYLSSSPSLILGEMTGLPYLAKFRMLNTLTFKSLFSFVKFRKIDFITNPFSNCIPVVKEVDEFTKILNQLFWNYVPSQYLSSRLVYKSRQRVWIGPDYSKEIQEIAAFKASGGVTYAFQHGGGIELYELFPWMDMERDLSERYYIWFEKDQSLFSRKLPSPKTSRMRSDDRGSLLKVLLTSTSHPIYFYRFHSLLLPESQLSFRNRTLALLSSLDKLQKFKVMYRPYPTDYGTGDMDRYHRMKFSSAVELRVHESYNDLLNEASLAIFDHPMTGFLQTLSMNIPTILCFDRRDFYLNDQTWAEFQRLKSVGIYHETEAALVSFIGSSDFNLVSWWSKEETQETVRAFLNKHTNNSKNWRHIWLDELKEILTTYG